MASQIIHFLFTLLFSSRCYWLSVRVYIIWNVEGVEKFSEDSGTKFSESIIKLFFCKTASLNLHILVCHIWCSDSFVWFAAWFVFLPHNTAPNVRKCWAYMLYRTCCSVSWHWFFILVSYLNDWFLFCGQLVNLWELWLNEFESLFTCFWYCVCQIS